MASHLTDGTGVVFYSTNSQTLLSYINSKITLSNLYELSNDVFVTRKFQKDKLYLSDDFSKLVKYGEFTLNQLNKNLINQDFILKIINNFLS